MLGGGHSGSKSPGQFSGRKEAGHRPSKTRPTLSAPRFLFLVAPSLFLPPPLGELGSWISWGRVFPAGWSALDRDCSCCPRARKEEGASATHMHPGVGCIQGLCCREEGPGRTLEAGRSWAGWWSGGPGVAWGLGAVEWGRRNWGFHPPLWVPVTAVTNRHSLGGLKQQKFSLTVRQGRALPEASGRVTFLAPQLLVAASLQCHIHLQHGLPCIFPSVSCKDT